MIQQDKTQRGARQPEQRGRVGGQAVKICPFDTVDTRRHKTRARNKSRYIEQGDGGRYHTNTRCQPAS